jgi:hypothetical protein
MVSALLLVIGSLAPWVSVSAEGRTLMTNGTDSGISSLIGVNGWVTFAAGLLLFFLVGIIALTRAQVFRLTALVVSLVAGGFATYDVVRIVQKISNITPATTGLPSSLTSLLDVTVAWGLIVMAIGAFGAVVFSILDLRNA